MRTPEEIKKGLECCIKNSEEACYNCPYMIDCETFDNAGNHSRDALAYITQLEQRLASAGKTCPEWISVEGRKPEGVVLVANFAPGTDGYKKMDVADVFDAGNSDITFYLLNGFDVEYNVTHWMPIPDAPPEKG